MRQPFVEVLVQVLGWTVFVKYTTRNSMDVGGPDRMATTAPSLWRCVQAHDIAIYLACEVSFSEVHG